MDEILESIQQMDLQDLPEVMQAIQWRYATAYPEWDVLYIAVHKDPQLRRRELEQIEKLLWK